MLTKLKQWWKSRTIKTATVIAMLSVLEVNFHFLMPLLGDKWYALTWLPFAMLMAYLRIITTQPIEEK